MTYLDLAIRDAESQGYKPTTENCCRPEFWRYLGRARGWASGNNWEDQWEVFISYMASGGDVERWFKEIADT